jgi:putative nucleotidyltransferase with HDIG domain
MNTLTRTLDFCGRNPILTALGGLTISCLAVEFYDLPLMILTLPVLATTLGIHRGQEKNRDEKDRLQQELSRMHDSTIKCLAEALDAKDQGTHEHIRRVEIYAVELGKLVNLNENQLLGLRAAAILHDIGKLAIPEAILNKPAKLTRDEFDRMKSHPVIGANIISHASFPYPVIPAVLYHHERFDGKGYPEGLRGEEIPLTARVLALADFYDALRSDRPYRRSLGQQEVLDFIRRESGKMFDPRLADLFCEHSDDFERVLRESAGQNLRIEASLAAFLKGGTRFSKAA